MKLGLELYEKAEANTNTKSVCSIDLEKDIVGDDEQKENFIRAWLYGMVDDESVKADIEGLQRFGIFLDTRQNFYDTIKGKKFKEYLGVYYQEELEQLRAESEEGENLTTETPDANKTKKRVITYQEV